MKKRILILLTLLCMVTALFPKNAITVSAYTGTKYGDYLYYDVKSNGEVAITDCNSSATEIKIPSTIDGYSVTSIDNGAFGYCYSLTSVTIPNSVTNIGDEAFYNCSRLTSVTIPKSVTSMGNEVFNACSSLTSINVDESNKKYCSVDGNLFNKSKTKLIRYAPSKSNTQYTIPTGVMCIGDSAFEYCISLTSITIPDSVTIIGNKAFDRCFGLTSITIPIAVTSIGSKAFYNCSRLTSVTLPDSMTAISNGTFSSCDSLTSVTIPDSVTSIGSEAFAYCRSLKRITIPNSVTSIGVRTFYNTGIYNDDSNWDDNVLYIGNHLIKARSSLSGEYAVKNGTKCIGDRAFSECENLTSVTIPNGVTSIGDRAFGICRLTSITIPGSVTSIGDYAFSNCRGLTSINVDESNKKYCSVDGNLFNKSKTNLIQYAPGKSDTQYAIPDSVTSIGSYAFSYCNGLTSVTLPDSLTIIGYCSFYRCDHLTSITIPNSVTSIGDGAFLECYSLTSVTIPNSVTSIGDGAFDFCFDLKNVYYNGVETEWNNISIESDNEVLTKATLTYFAYINIFDKDGNKVIDTTQNMGETVDTSSIMVPNDCKLKLYKDKEMTKEYSLDTPISENLSLYYEIDGLNKLKITGTESADVGQKGITESVTFATDKTAKDFFATIKYSDKLNFVKANSEIFDIVTDQYTDDGQKYLSLTCTHKNDGNMPINTTLNAFDLVFDVSESATANEKLTIEFVNDETFLADGGANTYDFDGLGTAEIKVNPIFVSGIAINGADEIDKPTQYTAVISPENATNKEVEWSVDNGEIATISQGGTLTPVKAGTVKITATAKDGSGISGEKSVNVKVYATITSLTASVGEWDKTFAPSEREYTIYVPKNTSSIKLTPTHNGTLLKGTTKCYSGKAKSISLTDTETVLTLTYSEPGYTDSEYKIKIVKFEGTKTTVSDNGTKFTVTPINIKGGTVILALYNGDTFVEMQSKPYTGNDIPFTTDKSYTNAKVMVWDSLESMTPICDVESVK